MLRRGHIRSLSFFRKTQKRGQLTLFILAGIVIIAVIIGIFFIVGNTQNKRLDDAYFQSQDLKEQVETLNFQIQECLDRATIDSLILVGFQGGYINKPQQTYNYAPFFFPFYYYEGKILMPSLQQIENELATSVSGLFTNCLDTENPTNFNLDYDNPITTTKITNQNLYVEVDMPLTIETQGHQTIIELSDFASNYNTSLYEIYEVAEYITQSHTEDPEYYCISCVAEMAQERDLYVYTFPSEVDETISGVMIYENRTGISNPYTFIFFNKYTGNEKTPKLST